MRGTLAGETLAQQKLLAFEQLQPEFEASFRFLIDRPETSDVARYS